MDSALLTASEVLVAFQSGELCPSTYLNQILDRITRLEPAIQAWEYLPDPTVLKQQIQHLTLTSSIPISPASPALHLPLKSIPIGIKDIFATIDMPTGWGTPIHQGTMRGEDATVVRLLRQAGAMILGKTVTTEYATARPGKTRNPHALSHTPGGSSSGSAAAVAAGMVPVAIGSQTLGSILRPAAYCGVLGFKPSFGSISRHGAMTACRELDQVGIFARSIADIALVCTVLAVPDRQDPDCTGNPSLQSCYPLPPQIQPPRLGIWRTPFWSWLEPEAQQRFTDWIGQLQRAGANLTPIDLPPTFDFYFEQAQTLMSAGLAANHYLDYLQSGDRLSTQMRAWIERGSKVTPTDCDRIHQQVIDYHATLATLWTQYDALIVPVTTGTAPATLAETGSPIFCALASLCGLPAISIPIGKAANGLPLAVQLISQPQTDRSLLQLANWAIDRTCDY